ncbi:MAG: hypothetical protein HY319_17905 [Armatimonadetes bacterium]|nr:hypothetical protein [Armatimonadota bacterium]
MDRLNPLSSEFQKTAARNVQSQVGQLRTQKDLERENPEPARDSVELTDGQRADAAARARKETSGRARDAEAGKDVAEGADSSEERLPEPPVPLPQRNPNEDTPTASLEAASRVVAAQVTSRTGPPADLKNVEGTAELQMKPAPLMPMEDIRDSAQPLPPDEHLASREE